MVYILGLEKYRPVVRATVLYALLAYMFYAGALLLDLGRPWKVINPIIGNSFGISSVLFLVAWHFILYMSALFIEFCPAIMEWISNTRLRKFFSSLTLAVVIFGITLSTLHQSGLGALFLMAKSKIHPLWYSEFIPILFFISSIFAGLSMVIIIETINQRVFRHDMSLVFKSSHRRIVLSLARVCTVTLFVYMTMTMLVFLHGKNYEYINTRWGYWYLVEVLGFVLIPCLMFMTGYRLQNLLLVRIAAILSIIGIVLNRLNISTITYQWYDNTIHYPTWKEVVVSAAVILFQILVFRWIIKRMPVYRESPALEETETKKKYLPHQEERRIIWKVSQE
jgi:Ni/Fe-hydrogenase subunit HybB-like protein